MEALHYHKNIRSLKNILIEQYELLNINTLEQ